MFLGGVSRRFPSLNFGFMEGGVSWACQMVNDLIEHWEKRRRAGLQHPKNTDLPALRQYIGRYGDARLQANTEAIIGSLDSDGFLSLSVEEIAFLLNVWPDTSMIERVLARIQELEEKLAACQPSPKS